MEFTWKVAVLASVRHARVTITTAECPLGACKLATATAIANDDSDLAMTRWLVALEVDTPVCACLLTLPSPPLVRL
jgi:hypothetical protein